MSTAVSRPPLAGGTQTHLIFILRVASSRQRAIDETVLLITAFLKNQLRSVPHAGRCDRHQDTCLLVFLVYNEHCRCPAPSQSTRTERLYSGVKLFLLITRWEQGTQNSYFTLSGYKEYGSLYIFLVFFSKLTHSPENHIHSEKTWRLFFRAVLPRTGSTSHVLQSHWAIEMWPVQTDEQWM